MKERTQNVLISCETICDLSDANVIRTAFTFRYELGWR